MKIYETWSQCLNSEYFTSSFLKNWYLVYWLHCEKFFLSNFIDLMKKLPKSFFFATWAFYWVYTQIQWWLDSRPSNTFVTLKCWYIFWKNSVKTTWVYLPKSLSIFFEKSVQHLSVKDWKWDTQCFDTLFWFVLYTSKSVL